ncbi:TPA: hypothetical protein N0F65_006487 [Lagenidium giganteum]|uniref:Uncharacterized protein n=1 Tax=Lagenidium giganteum TaxID=4803 RepID=A0AAV2YSN9_9STRA|nr:TPA: hypothetical protein N0F65_006487 [Lagenidium giganteum]
MPQAINELDVDFDAQVRHGHIQEIKRLISSTTDPDKRASLEEHLRELELASIQVEQADPFNDTSQRPERRKSFRPTSAKPRMTLTSLAEDKEMHVSAAHDTNLLRRDSGLAPLVADISSSSFDEMHAPGNALMSDQRTCWMSSGMFPQFLRLTLREPMPLASVEVTSRHAQKMCVRCTPTRNVQAMYQKHVTTAAIELAAAESDKLNTHRFALSTSEMAEVVEIVIESGYSEFVLVYYIRLRAAESSAMDDAKR